MSIFFIRLFMIIILFQKRKICGGYGDRLVGIISLYLIAKLLNKELKIFWDKEDINKYVNFDKYKITELPNDEITNLLDNRANSVKKDKNIFNKPISLVNLNKDISRYFYERDYYKEIFSAYKNLYDDILIPRKCIIEKCKKLIKPGYIIGIQIRTGDKMIGGHVVFIENLDSYIKTIFLKIQDHNKNIKNKVYFITSDNKDAVDIIIKTGENIIYNEQEIQHLDFKPKGDFSKIIIDHYFLSKYTKKMYISSYSNYGRTAALISNIDEIYDLECNKLKKENLLSKD